MTRPDKAGAWRAAALGAIGGIAALQTVMLAALFSRSPPFPPPHLAPLFGATLAFAILAASLLVARSRWFALPALAVAVSAVLSFGPHKLMPFMAQDAAIWPAILAGTTLVLLLGAATLRLWSPREG